MLSVAGGEVGEAIVGVYRAGQLISDVAASAENPIEGLPRVGSALKLDPYHAFPDIVDNYASLATKTTTPDGADLYQLLGSLNGKAGRFEWIVENGQVTHRYFTGGGTLNGIPIKP